MNKYKLIFKRMYWRDLLSMLSWSAINQRFLLFLTKKKKKQQTNKN